MIASVTWLTGWRLGVSLALLPACAAPAASPNHAWVARAWQSDDGLPDNNVTGLVQTPDGYLWVATTRGLARFDGLHFRPASFSEFPPLIRVMFPGRNGRLWIASTGGVMVRSGGGSPEIFTVTNGLPDLIAHTLIEDNQEALWIAYNGGSICRLKDGKVTRFTEQEGLPDGQSCSLAQDAQGRLWFSRGGKVGMFRDGRFHIVAQVENPTTRLSGAQAGGVWICSGLRLLKCSDSGELQDFGEFKASRPIAEARALLEDRSGAVWIGTSTSGLFRHDQAGFESIPTSQRGILSLAEDYEGNIWVGTAGGGLNRVRPRTVELEGADAGLPMDAVMSICEDAQGMLWATTQNRLLACRSGGKWSLVSGNANWVGERPTCVAADRAGALWIGTENGALHCQRGNRLTTWRAADGLAGGAILALLTASNGEVWIGEAKPDGLQRLQNGKLRVVPQPPDSGAIRAMAEDTGGNIWGATSKGLLLRVSGGELVDETPGSPRTIRCLCATADGSLWIGYDGWGLGRLKGGRFARISTEQGLYDKSFAQIVADGSGWLWFGAHHGIFKVRQEELEAVAEGRRTRVQSIRYGRGEGLRSLQANYGWSPGALRSRDERLWFPMRTGLAVVQPDRLRENLMPPPVLLERVAVDDQTVAWHGGILPAPESGARKWVDIGASGVNLTLPPDHRKLEFEFAALSFVSPENVSVHYQLEGFDADWIDAGTERRVTYPRLPEGEYRFRVRACNNDGVWNEGGATLAFTVRPFVWQTWWFRLTSLMIFTGGLVAIVRYVSLRRLHSRVRMLQQQDALHKDRARIAKDLHDDLGASLTQIALLSELAQGDFDRPEQAKVHLNEVFNTAHSLTRTLDEIVWAVSPRNDTVDRFVSHLSTFAQRFLQTGGVQCRLDVPLHLPARSLAPDLRHHLYFAVKEALNNVIKHAGASEVWLRVTLEPAALRLVVEDNGQGFCPDSAASAGGHGLANQRERMKEVGGAFNQQARTGHGTVTTFVVPLEPEPS